MTRFFASRGFGGAGLLAFALILGLGCNDSQLNPLAPDIYVAPEEINFGTVIVGVQEEQLLAVHNVGGGTLNVASVTLQDGTGPFSVEDYSGELTPENLVELVVDFTPDDLGPAEDVILIESDDPDEPVVEVPVYAVDVLPEPVPAIAWSPSSIDYGAVPSGGSVAETVTVTSVGTGDLQVTGMVLSVGTSPDFTLANNPAPIVLVPSSSTTVDVVYAPSDGVPDAGVLVITSNDPDTPEVQIPLSGELLPAPDIDLVPTSLLFGTLAAGNSETMSADIWNLGVADLELGTLIQIGSAEFTMLDDPSGMVLIPGEYTTLSIQYTQSDEFADNGQIEIPSNDPDEPIVYLSMDAPAPAPDIDVDPWTVDFGDVKIYTSASELVTISNVGTDDLDLYALTLAGDPEFSIVSNPQGSLVAPGASVLLEVGFEPHSQFAFNGLVDIESNDPDEPEVTVDLIGAGTTPLINLDPPYHYFGATMAGCEETVDVAVQSVGTAPLGLFGQTYTTTPGATMVADTGTLDSYIANGTELPPGDEIIVTVSFVPDDVLQFSGTLTVNSDDPYNPYVGADQDGDGDSGGNFQDTYVQQGNNWSDVLWVVDNSCSMEEEQGKLGDDFSYFYSIINNAGVDYHLSTVTTDNAGFTGVYTVIYPTTPNGAQVFEQNCNVGTNGSWTEQGLKFGYDALVWARNNQAPNQNFWRDDAGLRVVYVSDEEDQSGSWSSYLSYYQAMKANPDHVILNAIVGTDGYSAVTCSGLGGMAYPGTGYVDVANSTGGVLASICDNDWSTALTNLAWITINLADTFTLTYQAIPNTIEVYVNHVQAIGGWSYDAGLNAVVFDPAYVPDDGELIEIMYEYFGSC